MKPFARMSDHNWAECLRPMPGTPSISRYSPIGHRPIPVPEPDPEPNPAPDYVSQGMPSDILLADWSVLFCALQERLEQSASNREPQHWNGMARGRYESINSLVLRCAQDMKLLCPARFVKLFKT